MSREVIQTAFDVALEIQTPNAKTLFHGNFEKFQGVVLFIARLDFLFF